MRKSLLTTEKRFHLETSQLSQTKTLTQYIQQFNSLNPFKTIGFGQKKGRELLAVVCMWRDLAAMETKSAHKQFQFLNHSFL